MSNDVCLDEVNNGLRARARGGAGELDRKSATGVPQSIVYRRPGCGSGLGICKKTAELSNMQQSRLEKGGGGGGLKGNPSQKCSILNTFNIIDIDGGNRGDALNAFDEQEYIFGSTSPRGLSTSDYIGSGGGGGGGMTGIGGGAFDCGTGSRSLPKDSNESDNNISSCSTLDIVNKVDHLSMNELETQLRQLSQRLQKSERERDEYKRKLAEVAEEKESCYRRMEVLGSAHESRITEMHCVIAELSKKLRNKQENVIMEETEVEGSEISYQEGSVYNSELNLTNPDAECQTDPCEADYSIEEPQMDHDAVAKSQVEALQEEVLHLKAEIALLQSQIASNNPCSSPCAQRDGRIDELHYDDVCESADKKIYENDFYKTDEEVENAENKSGFYMNSFDDNNIIRNENYVCQVKNMMISTAVPKMAERVKLRRTVEDQNIIENDMHEPDIDEHIVSSLIQTNNLSGSFIEPSDLESEFQRQQRRIEQLKLDKTILSFTLDECKEHCDHLYLLCGKYESNVIALQSALSCSDRAVEAYDVMLALLESKLGLLKEKSVAAEESRQAVEAVARHLLDRLESEKDLPENSLGPWQNTFCLSDKPFEPWTVDDDNRLRNHVSKLKGRRSAVQSTAVSLESPFSSYYEKARLAFETNKDIKPENTKLDLEVVVDMQEMMNLREELNSCKQKRDEAERDRQFAIEKIGILQEALQQMQSQFSDSDALFNLTSRDRSSFSEADHAALTEQQLVEALTRESELKNRIQCLIGSVSASRKTSDEKYAQVQCSMKELQKMNLNLSQSIEQNKRKYQTKIKRLEQKILELNMELNQQHTKRQHHQHVHQRGLSHDNVPETTL